MKLRNSLLIAIVILCAFLFVLISIDHSENSQTTILGPKGDFSMAATGDVMFARNMPGTISLDSSPFEGVSDVVSNVDLLLVNFENAATTTENAVKGDFPFKCDPSYVPLLKVANNTVAALANNHALDYGVDGMHDTLKYLNESGISSVGAGDNEDAAHQPVVKNINGRKITILNYMDANDFSEYDYDTIPYANGSHFGYSAYDRADAQKQISENNDSDLIVAMLHYGNEYSTSPNDDQIRISHELIDDGVDVVIGSHPHVPQGVEMYNGKPIFYSLGNFIFDMSGGDMDSTYFVKIDLVNNTGECTIYPVYNSNFLPQRMDAEAGKTFINGLTPLPSEINVTDDGVGKLRFDLKNS